MLTPKRVIKQSYVIADGFRIHVTCFGWDGHISGNVPIIIAFLVNDVYYQNTPHGALRLVGLSYVNP